MTPDVIKAIGVYLDEIVDLSYNLGPAKEREIKARCEVIKAAVGVMTVDDTQDTGTGTGQQLKDYLSEWDKPSDQVAAEKGITVLMVEAVKNGLESKGLVLQFPSDPQYHGQGWSNVGSGGLPEDWQDRIEKGLPLQ